MVARIFLTAIVAGVLAGLFLTAIQRIQVVPIILEAEIYEHSGGSSDQSHGTVAAEGEGRHWAVEGGVERAALTGVANIIMAVAFSLLLCVGYTLRGGVTWQQGILWGLAGYLAVNIAPGLGLAPVIPGSDVAPLLDRQIWWVSTVIATSGGLALIAFVPKHYAKALALVLIVLPHVVGAPQAESDAGMALVELERSYIYATLIANCAFWIAMGALSGFLFNWNRGGRLEAAT